MKKQRDIQKHGEKHLGMKKKYEYGKLGKSC
jgi:hypothetical protein